MVCTPESLSCDSNPALTISPFHLGTLLGWDTKYFWKIRTPNDTDWINTRTTTNIRASQEKTKRRREETSRRTEQLIMINEYFSI